MRILIGFAVLIALPSLPSQARCEAQSSKWNSQLILAVGGNKSDVVEDLLSKGANPNTRIPGEGNTLVLQYAVENGFTATVKALLAHGADPNLRSGTDNYAPLMAAAKEGRTEIVDALLARHADVEAGDEKLTVRPLMIAAYEGHVQVVRSLLLNGADVDAKIRDPKNPLDQNYTALDQAVYAGKQDVVDEIKRYKAAKKQFLRKHRKAPKNGA